MKWLQKWFKRSSKSESEEPASTGENGDEALQLLELKGRQVQKKVVPVVGKSILELAMKNKVDWNSLCTKGTCARCRCQVTAGQENLSEPNDAEKWRLTDEEIEEGYRLGCQTKVAKAGETSVKHSPYF